MKIILGIVGAALAVLVLIGTQSFLRNANSVIEIQAVDRQVVEDVAEQFSPKEKENIEVNGKEGESVSLSEKEIILLAEVFSVQGMVRKTLVYGDGRITIDDEMSNTSKDLYLSSSELQQLLTALREDEVHIPQVFEPEEGVLYESSYLLTVNSSGIRTTHTSTNLVLENILEIIREAEKNTVQ
jgi:hypothetical protein